MEFEEKEKYEGIYTPSGETVRFTRTFAGHRFTDEECEALLHGETIAVRGLTSAHGKKYGVEGKLALREYDGHKFWGFDRTGFVSDFPSEVCSHKFTPGEESALKEGQSLLIKDFISKKGKGFGATIHYDKESGRIMFDEFYRDEDQRERDVQPSSPATHEEPAFDIDDIADDGVSEDTPW